MRVDVFRTNIIPIQSINTKQQRGYRDLDKRQSTTASTSKDSVLAVPQECWDPCSTQSLTVFCTELTCRRSSGTGSAVNWCGLCWAMSASLAVRSTTDGWKKWCDRSDSINTCISPLQHLLSCPGQSHCHLRSSPIVMAVGILCSKPVLPCHYDFTMYLAS